MNTSGIDAVLFDFDGTLTTPGIIDFEGIRMAISCPTGESILTYIDSLGPEEKAKAEQILDEFEMRAAGATGPAVGLEEILMFLTSHSIKFGILTRNTLNAVKRSLENIPYIDLERFDCVITRDDDIPVKPSPDGVKEASRRMGTVPERMFVIGDYIYDIEAGNQAGSTTIYLDVVFNRKYPAPLADYVIADLRSMILLPQKKWQSR